MYRIRHPGGRSAILYILYILSSCQKRNAETRNYPFAQDEKRLCDSRIEFFPKQKLVIRRLRDPKLLPTGSPVRAYGRRRPRISADGQAFPLARFRMSRPPGRIAR